MPIAVGPLEWLIMQSAPWLILIVLIAILVRMGRKKQVLLPPAQHPIELSQEVKDAVNAYTPENLAALRVMMERVGRQAGNLVDVYIREIGFATLMLVWHFDVGDTTQVIEIPVRGAWASDEMLQAHILDQLRSQLASPPPSFLPGSRPEHTKDS